MFYQVEKDVSGQYTIWSLGESGSRQDVIREGIGTKARAYEIIGKLHLKHLGLEN